MSEKNQGIHLQIAEKTRTFICKLLGKISYNHVDIVTLSPELTECVLEAKLLERLQDGKIDHQGRWDNIASLAGNSNNSYKYA